MLNSTFERIAGRRFIIIRERVIVNGYWMLSSRVNGSVMTRIVSVMARLVVPIQAILDPLHGN